MSASQESETDKSEFDKGKNEKPIQRAGMLWAARWELDKAKVDQTLEHKCIPVTANVIVKEGDRELEIPLIVYRQAYLSPNAVEMIQEANLFPLIMEFIYKRFDQLSKRFLNNTKQEFSYTFSDVVDLENKYVLCFQLRFSHLLTSKTPYTEEDFEEIELEDLTPDQLQEYEEYSGALLEQLSQYMEHTPFKVGLSAEGGPLTGSYLIYYSPEKHIHVQPDKHVSTLSDKWFKRWMAEKETLPRFQLRIFGSEDRSQNIFLINYLNPLLQVKSLDVSNILAAIEPDERGLFTPIALRFGEAISKEEYVEVDPLRLAKSQRESYEAVVQYILEQIEKKFRYTQYSVELEGKSILSGQIMIREQAGREEYISKILNRRTQLHEIAQSIDATHKIIDTLEGILEELSPTVNNNSEFRIQMLLNILIQAIAHLSKDDKDKLALARMFQEQITAIVNHKLFFIHSSHSQSSTIKSQIIAWQLPNVVLALQKELGLSAENDEIFLPWQLISWLSTGNK